MRVARRSRFHRILGRLVSFDADFARFALARRLHLSAGAVG